MIIAIILAFAALILLYFYSNEIEVRVMTRKENLPKRPNVGIVSDWHRKGVPYQSRFLSKCLSGKFNVHVFAYNDYVKDEQDFGYRKLVFSRFLKPWKLIRWIRKEGLKIVYFPDRLEDAGVLDWCKKNKVATVMIINYETIKRKEFPLYKKNAFLLCPVKCTFDLLKKNGFKNIRFIRWGIDNKTFKPARFQARRKVKFIHNAGHGGVEWRKNTFAVVDAFSKANMRNPDIRLVLKSQNPIREYPDAVRYLISKNRNITVIDRDLSMSELIKLYKSCNVSLLPSKWEGIGIPFIESLSLGLPVITVDAPPMNEWVRHGYNGFAARVSSWEARRDKELLVKAAVVDDDDYSRCIVLLSNRALLKKVSANAAKSMANSLKVFTGEIVKFTRSLCAK